MRRPLLPIFLLLLGVATMAALQFELPTRPPQEAPAQAIRAAEQAPPDHLVATPAPPPKPASPPAALPPSYAAESRALGQITKNPAAAEARLDALAAALDAEKAHALRAAALSGDLSHYDRFLATYVLGKRAADFSGDLEAIAASESREFRHHPRPHTLHELNWHFEVSLRITAMAALDRNPDRAHAAAFFQKVENSHSVETIRKVARVGRVGAEQGNALIDSYLTAKAEGALNDASQD